MDNGVDAEGRSEALRSIVELARQHSLSSDDIATALGDAGLEGWEGPEGREGRERATSIEAVHEVAASGLLVRVLGYIGGTFVFAGVCVFIALQWDVMTPAARVVITLGSGIAAFVLAVLADRDARFEKASTPLFLMAAALQPTGLLVLFDEYGSGGDWRWAVLIACGTSAAQFLAVFGARGRSTLLFLGVTFATCFAMTGFDLLDIDGHTTALVIGASLVLAAIGVDRTPHRTITPPFYLAGSIAALAGLFDVVERTPVELLFLVAAAGVVYLSVAVRSRTLLFVATLAILAYTGWFTSEHFADSVGWPIALVIFGLLLIGLSAAALRIDRRYLK